MPNPSPLTPQATTITYQSIPRPFALWADRVLAALIDAAINLAVMIAMVILIFVLFFILSLIGAASSNPHGDPNPIVAFGFMGFCCGVPFLFSGSVLVVGLYNKVYRVSKRGCSIGQGFMKLRVVLVDGSAVPISTLVLRLLVQVGFGLIAFLSLLSILWPLWDPQRQALHDKAVGTYVIKVD